MAESQSQSAVERARALFAAQRLPFPSLPANLAARLRQQGEFIFTTIDHQYSPYAIHYYAEPLIRGGDSDDYAVIGFDGHGLNSHAVHYYLVEGSLALFIQRPWGGVYMDPETFRPLIERAFKLAGELREKMAFAHRMGLVFPGRRLIVVLSMSDTYCGFGWLPAGEQSIVWHQTEEALEGALRAVTDFIDGQAN
jgi:hypothetical protein